MRKSEDILMENQEIRTEKTPYGDAMRGKTTNDLILETMCNCQSLLEEMQASNNNTQHIAGTPFHIGTAVVPDEILREQLLRPAPVEVVRESKEIFPGCNVVEPQKQKRGGKK